jgi:hypothetical protein
MLRRWARRVLMVSTYAAAFGVIQALAPALVVLLGAYDLVRRNGLASLRLLGLAWVFLLAELLGVVVAVCLWLWHVAQPRRDPDAFLEDNYRLQRWWARLLLGAGIRLLRLRLRVEGDAQAVPGPVVVLMRHTSILDTILPVVFLGARHGLRLRYVLKTELQLDPCLDIVGHRLPNCFVNRAGETEREVAAVGRMAEGLGPRDGALIYPEGTRFEPAKLARAQAKLAELDPELHALSLRLHRVLPPRPAHPSRSSKISSAVVAANARSNQRWSWCSSRLVNTRLRTGSGIDTERCSSTPNTARARPSFRPSLRPPFGPPCGLSARPWRPVNLRSR